jgi:hypothetical protein
MVGRNITLKNPVTPPGIDPRTIKLVAQRLNHYTTPQPFHRRCTILNSVPTFYNTYPVPGLYVQLFILCQQNMLWCQCFWSLLPSAGKEFIFFKTYLTECTNFLQKVKHSSYSWRLPDWRSMIHQCPAELPDSHQSCTLFKSITMKCYMDSPITLSADKISCLHGK